MILEAYSLGFHPALPVRIRGKLVVNIVLRDIDHAKETA